VTEEKDWLKKPVRKTAKKLATSDLGGPVGRKDRGGKAKENRWGGTGKMRVLSKGDGKGKISGGQLGWVAKSRNIFSNQVKNERKGERVRAGGGYTRRTVVGDERNKKKLTGRGLGEGRGHSVGNKKLANGGARKNRGRSL